MCRCAAPAHFRKMGLIPFLHTSFPAALRAALHLLLKQKCYPCGEHEVLPMR